MTIQEFAKSLPLLALSSVRIPLPEKQKGFKYLVTLKLAGKALVTEFTKGSGSAHVGFLRSGKWVKLNYKELKEWERSGGENPSSLFMSSKRAKPIPPMIEEALYCLNVDCSCIENNFLWEDFASYLGYNPDSISDKKVFEACSKTYKEVRDFFGYPKFKELLECQEE